MNPEAAWIDEGICLDITDSKVDVRIEGGVAWYGCSQRSLRTGK